MKKALLVGINYPGTQHSLRGCVNDIVAVNDVLVNNLGFTDPKQIRMLTDNSATVNNILDRLNWLVNDSKPGDVLYFHYSGHGSQIVNNTYDSVDFEPDGLDEIICPSDMNWRDLMITDDHLKSIFDRVPDGVNLTVTLDCCHSGDGLRDFLPPIEMRDDILGPTRTRAMIPPVDIMNRSYGLELEPKPRSVNCIDKENQKGLLISGCKSNQTSADAWIQKVNKYHGALTYLMIEILKKYNYTISYDALIIELNQVLGMSGFSQQPELNGQSKLFNHQFLKPLI